MKVDKRYINVPYVVTAIGILCLLAMLFIPVSDSNNFKFSTYSKGEMGAFALYETVRRVGFDVSRREVPLTDSIPLEKTLVIISPNTFIDEKEWEKVFEYVNRGGNVITDMYYAISDSLGIMSRGWYDPESRSGIAGPFTRGDTFEENDATIFTTFGGFNDYSISSVRGIASADSIERYRVHPIQWYVNTVESDTAVTIAGLKVGKGKIVIIANAQDLRNYQVWGGNDIVAFTQALHWIGNREVVFDEYYNGYKNNEKTENGLLRWIFLSNPSGRTTLQVILALIIAIIALSHRAILPKSSETVKRRSPLEHIGALANLYQRSNSVDLAFNQLVKGLRRRNPYNTSKSVTHNDYLKHIAGYFPATKPYVDILVNSPKDVSAIAKAVSEIESIISRS